MRARMAFVASVRAHPSLSRLLIHRACEVSWSLLAALLCCCVEPHDQRPAWLCALLVSPLLQPVRLLALLSQCAAGMVRALAYCHSRRVAHGSIDGAEHAGSCAAPPVSLLSLLMLSILPSSLSSPQPLFHLILSPAHPHSRITGSVFLVSTYDETAPAGPYVRIANLGFAVVGNQENGDELAEAARARSHAFPHLLFHRPLILQRSWRLRFLQAAVEVAAARSCCLGRNSPLCLLCAGGYAGSGGCARRAGVHLASCRRALGSPETPTPFAPLAGVFPLCSSCEAQPPRTLSDRCSMRFSRVAQGCQAPTTAADMTRIIETVFSLDWPEARSHPAQQLAAPAWAFRRAGR